MDQQYRNIYRELSLHFEKVQQLLVSIETPRERLLCAVLVDDMESLMEECESFLVDGVRSEKDESAFIERYEVVAEEVVEALRLHN